MSFGGIDIEKPAGGYIQKNAVVVNAMMKSAEAERDSAPWWKRLGWALEGNTSFGPPSLALARVYQHEYEDAPQSISMDFVQTVVSNLAAYDEGRLDAPAEDVIKGRRYVEWVNRNYMGDQPFAIGGPSEAEINLQKRLYLNFASAQTSAFAMAAAHGTRAVGGSEDTVAMAVLGASTVEQLADLQYVKTDRGLGRRTAGRVRTRGAQNYSGKTAAENVYFNNSVEFDSSIHQGSTGFKYKVFQRADIDWSMIRQSGAKPGRGLTNAQAAAKYGLAPILPDGNIATLHHSQQNAMGPLFEASTRYHHIANAQKAPLHPFNGGQHPHFPIGRGPGSLRDAFQRVDSLQYWKWRGAQEIVE